MPWRTIEATSTAVPPPDKPTNDGPPSRAARGAVVALVAAVLVAIAAFVLAFGSGAAGAVSVVGGAPLDAASSDPRGSSTGTTGDPAGPGASARVVVEIVGAVTHPGVLRTAARFARRRPRRCRRWVRPARRHGACRQGPEPGGDPERRRPGPGPVPGRHRARGPRRERRRARTGGRRRPGGPEPGHQRGARRSAGDRAGHGGQDHLGPRGRAVRDRSTTCAPASSSARRRSKSSRPLVTVR